MLRGTQGQKRPADVIGNAATIARIATGEIEETGYECLGKARAEKAGGALASSHCRRRQESASLAAACWLEGEA